jgi:hypothetical protein
VSAGAVDRLRQSVPGVLHAIANAIADGRRPGTREVGFALSVLRLLDDGSEGDPKDRRARLLARLYERHYRAKYAGAYTVAARVMAERWASFEQSGRTALPDTEGEIFERLRALGAKPLKWRQIAEDIRPRHDDLPAPVPAAAPEPCAALSTTISLFGEAVRIDPATFAALSHAMRREGLLLMQEAGCSRAEMAARCGLAGPSIDDLLEMPIALHTMPEARSAIPATASVGAWIGGTIIQNRR